MTDRRQLEIFIHLASSLHFGRSSDALHLSPSTLSRAVQKLESDVGQRLFERDNRRVSLTTAGRQFLPYAEQSLGQWRAVVEQMRQSGEVLRGEISLFCSVTAVYSLLAEILEVFRHRHPDIDLKVHTGDQAEALDRVLSRSEDVAITALPESLSGRMVFQPLIDSQLQLIAPTVNCAISEQLNASLADDPVSWADLPFILPERGVVRTRVEQWLKSLSIKPNIYAQVSGHEAIVSMVALGLGVGVVPSLVTSGSPQKSILRMLNPRIDTPSFVVGLATLKSNRNNPLIEAFWDCALSSYANAA
jgi:LysR family positive regulator for ilvC